MDRIKQLQAQSNAYKQENGKLKIQNNTLNEKLQQIQNEKHESKANDKD